MSCDYYIQTELIIEYLSENGDTIKISTNKIVVKGYIHSKTEFVSYEEELNNRIALATYTKPIYENGIWTNKEKYMPILQQLCIKEAKVKRIYRKGKGLRKTFN